jgi:hypothetical protein
VPLVLLLAELQGQIQKKILLLRLTGQRRTQGQLLSSEPLQMLECLMREHLQEQTRCDQKGYQALIM